MFRIPRTERLRLFKYVKEINVNFDPWNANSVSARELWRQAKGRAMVNSNPDVKVKVGTMKAAIPSANIKYVDGSALDLSDISKMSINEVMTRIHLSASAIDVEWAMEGKELDFDD